MESNINLENKIPKKIKLDFKESKYATGRRKKSVARIWIKKGTGKIYVNGKNMPDYFTRSNHQTLVSRPLEVVKRSADFDVRCLVKGGGLSGQAGAIIHGISRALLKYEPELKSDLKKKNLPQEIQGLWKEKNTVIKKLGEVFSFLKGSYIYITTYLILLLYSKDEQIYKCICCWRNRVHRLRTY